MEKSILEASTYYDLDVTHQRVSEAKAISDLLYVARNPDTPLITKTLKDLEAKVPKTDRFNKALYAICAVHALAFTYANNDPAMMPIDPLKVIGGKLFLNRPTSPPDPKNAFAGPKVPSQPMPKRRDLSPFRGQMMTLDQYKADHRWHGESNPIPKPPKTDNFLLGSLVVILDEARDHYNGVKGDSTQLVKDLLLVALQKDIGTIRAAGIILVREHGNDNVTGSVLGPLMQLLWGHSKFSPSNDCIFNAFEREGSKLKLTTKLVFMGEDNREWGAQMDMAQALWDRRDLRAYVKDLSVLEQDPWRKTVVTVPWHKANRP